MANIEIKTRIKKTGIKNWELAEAVGVSEATLYRWFRKPLPDDKSKCVNDALEKLIALKKENLK